MPPTVALALKWCREVKEVYNSIELDVTDVNDNGIEYVPIYRGMYYNRITAYDSNIVHTEPHYSYEAAESALPDKLLTLIEK